MERVQKSRKSTWKWLVALAVILLLAGMWGEPALAVSPAPDSWLQLGPPSGPVSTSSLTFADGTLYAGTSSEGVWSWNGTAWFQVGGSTGLSGRAAYVNSLAAVGSTVYAATDGGVWAWNGSSWSDAGAPFGGGQVLSLAVVGGAVYAGTYGNYVWAWNGISWSQVVGTNEIEGSSKKVESLIVVGNAVYAGTYAEGVWSWDGASWSQVGSSTGGPTGNTVSVTSLVAVNNAVYAGTGGGVWAWDGSSWSQVGGLKGSAATVNCLAAVGSTVYAATEGGVWAWDGTTWSQVGGSTVLTAVTVNSLAAVNGTLYAGTAGGVWAWDGSSWSQVGYTGLSGNAGNIDILAAAGNQLYAGDNSGNVWSWDGAQWTGVGGSSNLDAVDGDKNNGSYGVFGLTTIGGTLYAGTGGGNGGAGVWAWNGTSWSQVGGSAGLTGNAATVNSLVAVNNAVYAGTRDGVWSWDGVSWSQVGGSAGLTGNAADIDNLAAAGNLLYAGDSYGNVWSWDGTQWTGVGGSSNLDAVDGDNNAGQYGVFGLTTIGGTLYAGTDGVNGGAGVWAWNGISWSQVGGSAGLTGNAANIDNLAAAGNLLYAGDSYGNVWSWDGTQWTGVGGNRNLDAVDGDNNNGSYSVSGLTTIGNLLYAGTYGAGVWVFVSPISDLVSTSFTDTTASFSFATPVGATSVVLEQSTDNGTTWNPSTTGALSAASTLATATGLTAGTSYQFRLVVTGGVHAGDSNVVDVTTAAAQTPGGGWGGGVPALAITTTSLPAGTVGQGYNQTITTNGEGTPPYSFAVTGGSLPPGLALGADTGVIGGTPAAAGMYAFKVTVKDANDNSASESYNLTVTSAAGSGSVSPSAGGTVALGNDASVTIPPRALQGSAGVNVTITGVASPPAAQQGYTVIGAYEFTVNGQGHYTFNSPVTLTFRFDPAKVPAGTTPAIYYYDGTKWVLLTGTVDWTNDTVTVTVDHFTEYAVMVRVAVPLTDIAGNWAQANIEKLVSLGALAGYPDGTFRPDNDITRAEFATVLVKVLKLTPKTGPVFTDTQGSWAQGYIATAAAYGIVKGYDAGHFGPNDPVTREQMTTMVVRAANRAMLSGTLSFTDAARIDGWAREYVITAVKDGIVNGYPDGTYRPLAYATRAEAVTVIGGLLK